MSSPAADVHDSIIDSALLEVAVDEARANATKGGPVRIRTGDADIDAALEGGSMGMSVENDGVPVGRVVIYSTDDFSPREIPTTMLAKTLKKKRNGKPAFSIRPLGEMQLGTIMCYLHPDHPQYPDLAAIGLAGRVCGMGETTPAAHLASQFDLQLHMEHRHTREWAVIKENRDRLEREEERRLRREEIAAMQAMAASAGGVRQKAG